MADLLTLQQITSLKEAFLVFDKDGDGSITVEDLGQVFSSIGQNVSQKKLQEILNAADLDSNGVIDFPEFLNVVALKLHDPAERETELKNAFKLYDLGDTGFITCSNLKYVMARLGCALTTAQAYEMIEEADTTGTGMIGYEDFKRIMMADDE